MNFRKMPRYLSLAAIAACLLLWQAPAWAATIPEIVAKNKPALRERDRRITRLEAQWDGFETMRVPFHFPRYLR